MSYARDLAMFARNAPVIKPDVDALKLRPTVLPGDFTESYTGVPLGTGAQTAWRTIYGYQYGNVNIGDKFLVTAQIQLRNDYDFNVEMAPALTWSLGNPSGVDLDNHTYIDYAVAGHNVRSTINHYFDCTRTGMVEFTSAYTNVWFCFSMRCRSSGADGSLSQTIVVNAGQGGVRVMKLN